MKKLHCLSNGIRLAYEYVPYSKSVSVGVWVRAGSMYEKENESGISHFIEHMLFKGTINRTAAKIAQETDCMGGHINAYTERDHTCYYTRTPAQYMGRALDILSDMYFNSLFSEDDIATERSVIEEEINMYEDSPEDAALEGLLANVWRESPLGRDIAGSIQSVRAIKRGDMLSYMKRRYTPENTVLSVAGFFDEDMLLKLCEKYFCRGENRESQNICSPQFFGGEYRRKKDIEQTHISIGFEAFSLFDKRIYALSLLNTILGGSTSGRLFQSLREKSGLCYSIYSYTSLFTTTGIMGIYAGLSPKNICAARKKIEDEIEKVCTHGVFMHELIRARSILKCGIIMDSESIESKMSSNGKNILFLGRFRGDEEILNEFSAVTRNDIKQIANEVFKNGKKAVFILGGGVENGK